LIKPSKFFLFLLILRGYRPFENQLAEEIDGWRGY
jgi:hypothetical protein